MWLALRRPVAGEEEIGGLIYFGSYAAGAVAVLLGVVVLALPLVL
jgi:hypothetical protein